MMRGDRHAHMAVFFALSEKCILHISSIAFLKVSVYTDTY